MNELRWIAALALSFAVSAFAQTASFTAAPTNLAAAGGEVTLTAIASYEGEPGAIGWSIVLPANWTLVSVNGPNVPAIAPKSGAEGALEFAYTAVPARRAEFRVTVRYPAGVPTAKATSTAIVRTAGNLKTLMPPPVIFESK
jgi:hypothetical protein